MFAHQPSGLYLTLHRAYDPYSGRWLSRDPAGELIGSINVYAYADGNPVDKVDPRGDQWIPGVIIGALSGGLAEAASENASCSPPNLKDIAIAAALGAGVRAISAEAAIAMESSNADAQIGLGIGGLLSIGAAGVQGSASGGCGCNH